MRVATAFATIVALVCTVSADAGWATSAAGAGAAKARTMPAGNVPGAARTGLLTVRVTWSASTFAPGVPVGGYVVRRYDSDTGIGLSAGGTCAGVVSTLTCDDSVAVGSWRYTVSPAAGSWRGAESAAGNTVA